MIFGLKTIQILWRKTFESRLKNIYRLIYCTLECVVVRKILQKTSAGCFFCAFLYIEMIHDWLEQIRLSFPGGKLVWKSPLFAIFCRFWKFLTMIRYEAVGPKQSQIWLRWVKANFLSIKFAWFFQLSLLLQHICGQSYVRSNAGHCCSSDLVASE